MKKVNRNILNAVLVGAGFVSSLLMINKNKVITKKQTIPAFFQRQCTIYICASRWYGFKTRANATCI
ncbi:glycerophosphoryl diester phosphodiesterase [Staphylococcus aureus]|nr:glycerophosphoryl diester phosphodiesterase [Staphylococcus aureus]